MSLTRLKLRPVAFEIVRTCISQASFLLMLRGVSHVTVFLEHIRKYLPKDSGTAEGKKYLSDYETCGLHGDTG